MSDIDWSEAPEDCLGAIQLKEEKEDYEHGIFVTKTDGCMEDGYHYCGHTNIGPIMSLHDFIPKPDNFDAAFPDGFDDMTPKPSKLIFTQAMADNGELPPIGSEVGYNTHSEGDVTGEVTGYKVQLSHNADDGSYRVFIYFKSNCRLLGDIWAIEPPIELVDGKAYQFDVEFVGTVCGVYCKKNNELNGVEDNYTAEFLSNLVLLTPEVKS